MERSRPNKVVLTMSMESLIDDNVMDALKLLFGDRLSSLDHNQLLALALALAYTEEEISNERLQYALEMHKADISQMLGKMCKLQFLESSGRGRGTTYHVYGVDMPQMGKVATSDQKVATTKRHYSKEELRKKILNYCTEWRTLDDISSFIERDRNYLRNKVLPRMTDILEKMYESIPHHPRQKYRAKQRVADE